ncbi:type II secretion system minor pseudopilin GspH [Paraglaciecola aquimarina]|uniref:Type II secretion system protein H n=1 Tax=Paraglaciecola aquimarina TaxID=1235557 RepID=A0ABU3ST99_9ALTE|nr:type II secretion system minor pseudopilin GspH [Paraglaciecola aquimarina]MDU0353226.1 type II secretion system minor pseudopilin GspH [Paraglaciecola aquimarina]
MPRKSISQHGFTLIEVMLVLVIMGLAASAVVFNFNGQTGDELLKKQTQRLEVIFNMASDYAVLNQRQLGLRVEQKTNSYYFMLLDENQEWQKLEGQPTFEEYELPEFFKLELSLTDLPWETDNNLFSTEVFDEESSFDEDIVQIGDEEDIKLLPPQVFIFSSGEITPFSLSIAYEPEFTDELPVYYRLNGLDSVPLEREGPLDELLGVAQIHRSKNKQD